MSKKSPKKIVSKIASVSSIKKNAKAFESYNYYRKTLDVIERTNIALGKKQSFQSDIGSTVNFEVNQHAILSTKTQKI